MHSGAMDDRVKVARFIDTYIMKRSNESDTGQA